MADIRIGIILDDKGTFKGFETLEKKSLGLAKASDKAAKSVKSLGASMDPAKKQAEAMAGSLGAAGAKLEAMAGRLGAAGAKLTAGLTVPLTAAVGMAVKFASDFNGAMTKSLAIMGTVSGQMRAKMGATARAVSRETGLSSREAAESYFFLASAGMSAAQSVGALPTVARFAKAGMFDMAQATSMAVDAQTALGMRATDAAENLTNLARVTDVLVKANVLSNASVAQFSEALTTKSAAAARNYGQSIEQVTAVLAAYADQGVKGRVAGERYSILLREMSKAALENAGAWKRLKIDVFDAEGNLNRIPTILAQMEKAFGGMSTAQRTTALGMLGLTAESQDAAVALLGMSGKISEYEGKLRQAGGATKEIADQQLKAFSEQLLLLRRDIEDVAVEFGTSLLPTLQDVVGVAKDSVPYLSGMAKNFEALPGPAKGFAVALGAVAASAGPALYLIGGMGQGAIALKAAWVSMNAAFAASAGALTAASVAMNGFAGGIALVVGYGFGAVIRSWIDTDFPRLSAALDRMADQLYEVVTGVTNAQRAAGAAGPIALPPPRTRIDGKQDIVIGGGSRDLAVGSFALSERERAMLKGVTADLKGVKIAAAETTPAVKTAGSALGDLGDQAGAAASKAKRAAEEILKIPKGMTAWLSGLGLQPINSSGNAIDVFRIPGGRDMSHLSPQPRGASSDYKGPIGDHTQDAVDSTIDWADALAQVDQAFRLLGVSANSVLGQIVGGITAAMAAQQRAVDIMTDKDGNRIKWGDLKDSQKLGVGLAGAQVAAGAYAGGSVLSGAASGAAFGAAFGPWGAAIGGVAGGLLGWIGGGKRREAERQAREAGRVLGTTLSKEMAEAISARAKELGISIKQSALLSVPDLMSEKGAVAMGSQFMDLLKGVAAGTLPVTDALGKAYGMLSEELLGAGAAGHIALGDINRLLEESGVHLKEVRELVRGELTAGAGGLAAMIAGGADLQDVAGDFYMLRDALTALGLSGKEIRDILGPALDAAVEAAQRAGEKIPPELQALIDQRQILADNSVLIAGIEGWNALNRATVLAGAGTAETYGKMQDRAHSYMEQLKEAGIEGPLALEQIAPTLRYLDELASQGRITLDAQTQAYIDQAKAAGLMDPSPQEQILNIQNLQLQVWGAMATMLGVTLPDNVQKYIDKLNQIPGVPGAPGGPAAPQRSQYDPTGAGLPPDYTAAAGFGPRLLARDTLIQAHAGELAMVVPKGMAYTTASQGFGRVTVSPESGPATRSGSAPDLRGLEAALLQRGRSEADALAAVAEALHALAQRPAQVTLPNGEVLAATVSETQERGTPAGRRLQRASRRAVGQRA